MKAWGEVFVAFPDAHTAALVERATRPENRGFLVVHVEGATARATAEADSVASLRRTLDDFLAAASVAAGVAAAAE